MTRSRPALVLPGVLAAIAAVASVWLLVHNPTVSSASMGAYTCSAPYDTVLLDADNVPGGEPPADADKTEARCIDAGKRQFVEGAFLGSAAVALAALTAVLAARGRARTKEDLPQVRAHSSSGR